MHNIFILIDTSGASDILHIFSQNTFTQFAWTNHNNRAQQMFPNAITETSPPKRKAHSKFKWTILNVVFIYLLSGGVGHDLYRRWHCLNTKQERNQQTDLVLFGPPVAPAVWKYFKSTNGSFYTSVFVWRGKLINI